MIEEPSQRGLREACGLAAKRSRATTTCAQNPRGLLTVRTLRTWHLSICSGPLVGRMFSAVACCGSGCASGSQADGGDTGQPHGSAQSKLALGAGVAAIAASVCQVSRVLEHVARTCKGPSTRASRESSNYMKPGPSRARMSLWQPWQGVESPRAVQKLSE